MKTDNRYLMIQQAALRAGISLFMLFGAGQAFAQDDVTPDEAQTAPAAQPAKKANLPQYVMKEVRGTVYDAGSRQPLSGVRVQALGDKRYTAMTDEKGEYTVSVPEHVTALYVATEGYNAVQVGLRGTKAPDAYVYSTHFKPLYADGVKLLNTAEATFDTPSAISMESELDNQLNAAVRTVNRGGLPAQGALMLVNGLNSLNTNAQPLVVVDGVIWDMQYDRASIHDGFFNNIFNHFKQNLLVSSDSLSNFKLS